jgi:hypothetical protein
MAAVPCFKGNAILATNSRGWFPAWQPLREVMVSKPKIATGPWPQGGRGPTAKTARRMQQQSYPSYANLRNFLTCWWLGGYYSTCS